MTLIFFVITNLLSLRSPSPKINFVEKEQLQPATGSNFILPRLSCQGNFAPQSLHKSLSAVIENQHSKYSFVELLENDGVTVYRVLLVSITKKSGML